MLKFDLTSYDIFKFPISSKNIDYDLNGDVFSCNHIVNMSYIPQEMFVRVVNDGSFIVLMRNEIKPGYRKYECDVEDFRIDTRSVSFIFHLVEIEKNEYRKLKIKNIMSVL